MTTTEWNTTSSGLGFLTDHPPSSVSTAPGPSIAEAGVDGLGQGVMDPNPSTPPIDSNDGGVHQVSAIQSHEPLIPCNVRCIGPAPRSF